MTSYPIDTVIPDIIQALRNHSGLLLQAPPGAGKTTRLPLALLAAPFLRSSRIVILEPRRLAAVNAARWMASAVGEEPGGTIGYTIRFESKVSRTTRIEVVTEGILTRRLQHDPELTGVGLVIFDEFHERSLHADLALALCRDVQSGLRPDLKLMVMSATLDCAPIAQLLGDVPIISSRGKNFPVDIHLTEKSVSENFLPEVTKAVLRSVTDEEGDILVFLPGAGEINRCRRLLEERRECSSVMICPLYGDLSFAEQEKAIQPLPGRRKVVLATNIAETSLTIERIKVVIDSGWYRRLRFDPSTGLNRLVLERISNASAEQRTGRAGRLGPGKCYRLWSDHQQRALLPFHPPEIATADLASLALDLALWGIGDPSSLGWLDLPPASAYAEARKLLVRLKALDSDGRITSVGRRMAELPLHPRIAALLIAADECGAGRVGADMAALLSERDILRTTPPVDRVTSRSDILDRLDLFRQWRRNTKSPATEAGAPGTQPIKTVERTAAELRRFVKRHNVVDFPGVDLVGDLLTTAYPDRTAMRREPGSRRYLLANGRGCVLTEQSALNDEPWLVAVNIEGGDDGEGRIRIASAISVETLRNRFSDQIYKVRVVGWDKREGRVICREEERFDRLVLSSRQLTATPEEAREALLDGLVAGSGLAALSWNAPATGFLARVRFLARTFPEEWPDLSEGYLTAYIKEWLAPFICGITSVADLRKVELLAPLQSLLSWEQKKRLDEGAPTHITVPSGSRIRIDYESGDEPVLAVKLQELFGMVKTPCVAWGKVAVLLHLLSPAGRPIQVTRDLTNFWNAGYPAVKKELKGRYPKHPWPDDPWNAAPTRHAKRKGSVD